MLTAWGRWREDCLQMRIFVALPSPSRLTDFTLIDYVHAQTQTLWAIFNYVTRSVGRHFVSCGRVSNRSRPTSILTALIVQ